MKLSKKKHLEKVIKLFKKHKSSQKVAKDLCEEFELEYTETLSRKIRRWISDAGLSEAKVGKPEDSKMFKKALKRKVRKSKYRIISCAQNATPIREAAYKSMMNYAKYLGAEVDIVPLRYSNPTSTFKDKKHDWWDSRLDDQLIANRCYIHNNLMLLADVKTQPTAAMPLTSMEGLSGAESCIIAHPRQHFKSVHVLEGQPAKFLMTTGCITEKN